MSRQLVGKLEQRDINAQIDRVLRDLGNPAPPLSLDLVRELLSLDRQYYSKADTSFLDDVRHRLLVGGKQLIAQPLSLLDVLRKTNLSAFYVPDARRILIDRDVPQGKHRWIEAHEILHGVIDWHRDFCFGDNKFTLNPGCDATIEAEANYGGGRLLFLGNRFGEELRSSELNFENIRRYARNYGNSIQSTLWRSVEEVAADRPAFGIVSVHPNHPTIGGEEYRDRPRFIRSDRFRTQFANVSVADATAVVSRHANRNRGGPVVQATDTFLDANGDEFEFRIESFSNQHALLTYGVRLI